MNVTSGKRMSGPVAGGVFACAAIVLTLVGCDALLGPTPAVAPNDERLSEPQPARKPPAAALGQSSQTGLEFQPAIEKPAIVEDDGKTLWVSPTHGPALELGYLPPGAQLIAVLRPAALLKHPEGEKVRAALGPAGQAGMDWIEQATKLRLAEMEQLLIGSQAMSDGKWYTTLVVHAVNTIRRETLVQENGNGAEKNHAQKKYWLLNERAYYLPSAGKGKILVVAPANAIADIIDLAGSAPPLRRDIERLIAHTDADRHVTFIVAPNSLFGEGQSIFAGQLTALRQPLFWFLGDEFSGATFSMHWGENFFLELMATPSLETSPERASRIFAQRVEQIADKLAAYVASIHARPYGGQLVARLPAMVRAVAGYTRSGFEPDHSVLRCYLPVAAGHNLLMAGELTLAETGGGAPEAVAATGSGTVAAKAGAELTVHDALAKTTSLKFAKDTLEAALDQLSQDIGVPIVIRGPDLQAEGITKNQSFGIDISNKPAGEILVQILRLANPDKSATSASDPRQKLVYVVARSEDGTEQVIITTRARAAERHEELPPAFRPVKP